MGQKLFVTFSLDGYLTIVIFQRPFWVFTRDWSFDLWIPMVFCCTWQNRPDASRCLVDFSNFLYKCFKTSKDPDSRGYGKLCKDALLHKYYRISFVFQRLVLSLIGQAHNFRCLALNPNVVSESSETNTNLVGVLDGASRGAKYLGVASVVLMFGSLSAIRAQQTKYKKNTCMFLFKRYRSLPSNGLCRAR